uniref:Uncharacterized protein n=1 Tax=Pinctada fucata TaxID=50426 RepID=A0A194ALM2_PINFU
MSSIRLGEDHYTELLAYLKNFWPKSLMLCSIVRTLRRGIPVGFNVWVDRWPSPQAVIVNADEEKCQVECWKKIAFVFETNTTSFIPLFSDVERDTMKNKTERGYVGISPGTFEDLKAAFPQCRLSLHETQAMWLIPENHSRRKRTTCLPDGFQTGSMSRKISDMIVAHAPHFEGYISSDAIFKPVTMYKMPVCSCPR